MSLTDHILFLACVALATYAQTTTGFAFSLILLGLAGVLSLSSLPEMTNVVNMLALVNAFVALRGIRANLNFGLIKGAFYSSTIGVVIGVAALHWISGDAIVWLSGLLGLTILLCAMLLIIRKRQLSEVSPPSTFVSYGLLAGLMGGLFSSAGPPMVYHMYRQPLSLAVIRDSLLIFFAANAALRIVLVGATGGLTMSSVWLAVEALPVVAGLTWLVRRYASLESLKTVKLFVFFLLLVAGLGLVVPAAMTLFM
jgi:hypothetical protein